ncbi:MAG: hypothetical protein ACREO1_10710 [Arenimonas sp.]
MKRLQFKMAALACLLLMSAGCASVQPRVQGSDFQEGVKSSTTDIAELYSGLNDVETDVKLFEHATDTCGLDCGKTCPTKKNLNAACACRCEHLDGVALNGKVFSEKSVKARLSALKVLNAYAKGIAEISSTESPQVANENLQALGSEVKSLSDEFNSLGAGDNRASKYVEPLSALAGLILENRLERKRKAALKAAIISAGPIVTKISELLREDLTIVILANQTAYAQTEAELVNYYNAKSASMAFAARQSLLEKIREVGNQKEMANELSADEMVDGILLAHKALVAFANSEQKSADIEKVNAALKAFNQ